MTIFEEKDRPDLRWKNHVESDFEYLDRCGRPEAVKVRGLIEEWFARFPIEHQPELRSRLRSRDDHAFQSASFELVLYACMSSLGYVVDVHPELPNGSAKRPDFLVRHPNGAAYYLEAVLASDYDAAEMAARKRFNVVLESLEGINSPNFFLGITPDGNPEKPPPTKKLRSDLQTWLSTLDPDQVTIELEPGGSQELPIFHWKNDGWNIKFEALPKKPEARGKGQRVIGMQMSGADWVNSWEPLREAVKAKGGRYGEMDKPMLIAVSVNSPSLDRIDEVQALFGQEQFILDRRKPGAEPRFDRAPNGAWRGPKGPQYTRVSGVWIFQSMDCWHAGIAKPTLYFNPHAKKPLPDELTQVSHAKVVDGYLKWSDGKTPREILGLPDGWPT